MRGLLFKGAKRRVFAFMAAIALSFSLIGVVPARRVSAAQGDGTTILNPNFENGIWGNDAGWSISTNAEGDWDADGTYVTQKKYGDQDCLATAPEGYGEYYVNCYSKKQWRNFYFTQTISLEPGKYTFYVSGAGADSAYCITVGNVTGSNSSTSGWGDWNSASCEFETEEAVDSIDIIVSAWTTVAEGYITLDNFRFDYTPIYSATVNPSAYQKNGTSSPVAITVDSQQANISAVSVANKDPEVNITGLTASDYSVEEITDETTGYKSTVITLAATYLNNLPDGEYIATITFADDDVDDATANFTITSAYTVTNDKWIYNKDLAYSTQSHSVNVDSANGKIASVKVGDATLTATTDYTLANDEGKTNLVFTETYLKSLDAGKYTATIAFSDGAADKTASFTITEYPTGLQNGGFENGIGSYWNGGFAVSENDNNNNGKYLNLWVSNNGEASLVQNFKAESTGTFDISYKVIGDGNSGIAFWVNDEKIGEIEGGSYSWPEVTTTKSFDLKKDDIVKFEIKGTYSGTWAAIDDVRIVEHKDVQEELPIGLQNGDFEKSDYWVLPKAGPFDITYTNGKPNENGGNNDGKYLAYWTDDLTNEYEATQTFKAEADGDYVISYDYLGEGEVGLSMYINGTPVESLEGSGWNEGKWTSKTSKTKFTLTKDQKVTFSIKGTTKDNKAYIKLDNIKIEKYVPKDREFDYDTTIATGAPVDTEELYVEKLDLAEGFITGVDISSYASIVASGATYKDAKGKVLSDAGFFKLLKESGVNYVRIRVWVDPKDANNHYYGGGNCDVATAIKLGQYATLAGMRVLIDFHYSDFWTDPGKQNAPKAWKNLSLTEKAATLKRWTIDSLTEIIKAGVDVGMVQIGNETTTGFCGETNMTNMCTLFKAGSEGVQAVETELDLDTKIMMVIHLTNPNDKDFSAYAQKLKDNGVVYDVFATSFYPYWHGTLDNLYNKLSAVAKTYDKYVMVAETSYVRTLEDGDGWENTETQKKYDDGTDEFPYDISEQGQVLHIRNVIKTVSSIEGGIGVFWWEPAWIPVENWADAEDQDAVLASNKAKWETYGSGWAASAAAEYDPNVGSWYGGSAVDNESWFDFDGTALESLKVYNMVRFGTTTEDYTLGAIDAEYAFVEGEEYELPTQIEVRMASGKTSKADVTWNMDQVKEAVKQGRGTYQIDGTYTYDGVEYEDMATLNLTIKPVNLLTNGSFEDGKGEGWNFDLTHTTGIDDVEKPDGVKEEDSHDGKYTFHFYSTTPQSFEVTQTLTLEPGAYAFNGFFQGLAGVEGEIFAIVGDEEYVASYTLNGWVDWQYPEISKIIVTEKTEVTVGFRSSYSAKDWGTCDDFTLYRMGDIFTVTFENNGHGTAPEALIVVEGETIDEPDKLVADKKDQVEFTGWYTDKECKNKFDFDTEIIKDITLYAGWKSTAKQTFALESSSQNVTWIFGGGDIRLIAHGEPNDAETFEHYKGASIAKAADVAAAEKAGENRLTPFASLGGSQIRAESGSLRLTIFASYLETLEPGDYILRIEFDTDAIETTITIKAKEAVSPDADVKTDDKAADASVKTDDKAATNSDSAPKTGDDTPVSAVMLILLISAAGLSYMLGLKRVKRR